MSQISDIVRSRNNDKIFIIMDIQSFQGEHYMFYLYDFSKCICEGWFEPFDKQLNNGYWETLA